MRFVGGGWVVVGKLCDTIGGSVCLEILLEKDVSNGGGGRTGTLRRMQALMALRELAGGWHQ